MKIQGLNMRQLRNDEFFQLFTEVKILVERHTPETLCIVQQFNAYKTLYEKADAALKKLIKSHYTQQLADLDRVRDEAFSGLAETNNTARKRSDPAIKAAAIRLDIPLGTYGSLAKKPYNEETSAIYNLLQDLKSAKYLADAATAGLTPWMQDLEAANNAFASLMRERFDETTARDETVMRDVRIQLEEAYNAIVERVHAKALFEGTDVCDPFIASMNTLIAKYDLILKQRAGRAKAAKKNGKGDEEDT